MRRLFEMKYIIAVASFVFLFAGELWPDGYDK